VLAITLIARRQTWLLPALIAVLLFGPFVISEPRRLRVRYCVLVLRKDSLPATWIVRRIRSAGTLCWLLRYSYYDRLRYFDIFGLPVVWMLKSLVSGLSQFYYESVRLGAPVKKS